MQAWGWGLFGVAWLLAWAPAAALAQGPATHGDPAADVSAIDPAGSRFGFEVKTRLGRQIAGIFPRYEGRVERLPDGRHQVRVRLFTRFAEIPDRPTYTAWMRSETFFDSARFPVIEFESHPFDPVLLTRGGPMPGTVTIRGISREESLLVTPSACADPGRGCPVMARGAVRRNAYGMDNWSLALGDQVVLVMSARVHEVAP